MLAISPPEQPRRITRLHAPAFPQCGFSAAAVQILSQVNVNSHGIDVLGGCNIIREMFQSAAPQEFLQTNDVEAEPVA